jgi:hypothetical protein
MPSEKAGVDAAAHRHFNAGDTDMLAGVLGDPALAAELSDRLRDLPGQNDVGAHALAALGAAVIDRLRIRHKVCRTSSRASSPCAPCREPSRTKCIERSRR